MTPDALANTHAAAFTAQRSWATSEFASLMSQSGMILCGDAKSFVLGRVIADEAEVLTLATHPDFQRQGLANLHLLAFLQQAQAQEAARVFLEVSEDNIFAKALYLKHNFSNVGFRPAYYTTQSGAKIGANVMERIL